MKVLTALTELGNTGGMKNPLAHTGETGLSPWLIFAVLSLKPKDSLLKFLITQEGTLEKN